MAKNTARKCRYFLIYTICFSGLSFSSQVFAKKTNQAVFEEGFDQAAGGASLTRASKEGVMFANPALMPYGGKFFRWLGLQFSVISNKESIDRVQTFAQSSGSSSASSESSSEETDENLVQDLFTTPIHIGIRLAMSFISNNFGVGLFARLEPDIRGQAHDDTGVPEMRARAEAYYGGVSSLAMRLTDWFSVGATVKYMYAAEPDVSISFADQARVEELSDDPSSLTDQAEFQQGTGFDAGVLFFKQGDILDLRLAGKVDDIGDTKFGGVQDDFKQTIHGGLGITFHNSIDSIHLSADYRDVLGAYGESTPMRVYAGARLLLRNYVGLAVGLYQGYPSFGARVDLLLIKVGFTAYTREMGEYLGEDPRTLYVAYFGMGI